MRYFYIANNRLGYEVLKWLKTQDDELVGLSIHHGKKRSWGEEILDAADLPEERIFDASRLSEPETINAIKQLKPDIGVSILFGYILRKPFFSIFPKEVINLHPGMLPFNRGAHTNIWSIVEGTPAGTTLHYIDEGVDTGDIIAQREVTVSPTDTGKTLYRKLEDASFELFRQTWPKFRTDDIERTVQPGPDEGSNHRVKDLNKIDEIQLDQTYSARELINILRARSFPPYKGAWFEENGQKIYINLDLKEEKEFDRDY